MHRLQSHERVANGFSARVVGQGWRVFAVDGQEEGAVDAVGFTLHHHLGHGSGALQLLVLQRHRHGRQVERRVAERDGPVHDAVCVRGGPADGDMHVADEGLHGALRAVAGHEVDELMDLRLHALVAPSAEGMGVALISDHRHGVVLDTLRHRPPGAVTEEGEVQHEVEVAGDGAVGVSAHNHHLVVVDGERRAVVQRRHTKAGSHLIHLHRGSGAREAICRCHQRIHLPSRVEEGDHPPPATLKIHQRGHTGAGGPRHGTGHAHGADVGQALQRLLHSQWRRVVHEWDGREAAQLQREGATQGIGSGGGRHMHSGVVEVGAVHRQITHVERRAGEGDAPLEAERLG